MSDLKITLVQADIIWEDPAANRDYYQELLQPLKGKQHVVVLPEMFTTGFSMATEKLAEKMDGPTVEWMKEMARSLRTIITGSLIIEDEGHIYNRMLWVLPTSEMGYYDKRHLFSYSGEDKHFTPGDKRMIVGVNGWKICLNICYDLRFPVWSRNTAEPYDILLYVANWPAQRNIAWETLLRARAIENQCYAIGVNRVGKDANGLYYTGNSSVYDALGELIWKESDKEVCHTITLQQPELSQVRERFRFLEDRDQFILL